MNRRVQSSLINRQSFFRRGFSMVEALVAVSVTTIAGAALLTSIGAAVRSSTDATHAAVARGLAEQLMDEIAASRFPDSTTTTLSSAITRTPLSATYLWGSRMTREAFDDIDDYDGWTRRPPVDRQGHRIGTEGALIQGGRRKWHYPRLFHMRPDGRFLQSFTREVQVERIRPDTGSDWTVVSRATDYRRVTVRVKYTDAESHTTTLAEISRIFSYVPAAP